MFNRVHLAHGYEYTNIKSNIMKIVNSNVQLGINIQILGAIS